MRKESKNRTNTLRADATIQNYHNGIGGESYAFNGFGKNLYFVSDRAMELLANAYGLVRADGKALKGFGIEWECVSVINSYTVLAEIMDKIIFPLFPKYLWKMQHDGSLGGNSNCECITQVMTKEFIRNHYADFKSMYEYLKPLNTLPNDDCGMHCNISVALFGKDTETQNKNIMKLHNFINLDSKHYNFACDLLKRNRNRTSFCGKMRADYLDPCGSHYYSMNYKHLSVGRLEIRLVGPQKSFGSFRNTMEVIFHLIEKSKELNENDFVNNPIKLWKGCNRYVLDRLNDIRDYFTIEQWQTIKENADTTTQYI